jgi:hypothetical protein
VAEAAGQSRIHRTRDADAGDVALAVQQLDAVAVGGAEHGAAEAELGQRELELDLEAEGGDVPVPHLRE